jgi:hypothetical protein
MLGVRRIPPQKAAMKTNALAGIFVLAQATSFYVALDTHSDQCRIMVTGRANHENAR